MDRPSRLAALRRAHIEHLQSDARRRVATLSDFEFSLLKGILAGQSPRTQASAHELNLAELEGSVAVVLKKLGAVSNADAVRIGIYAGMEEMD